ATVRWLDCEDAQRLGELKKKAAQNLALDASGALTYLAPNLANLRLAQERWPETAFHTTREL
ncbi:MAG TPA: peptide chain release factor 3, partial [Gammaproteobacteria bacterium]|nr:peptide chain release factor 3 [Gammaproteobacteria bacterium]